MFYLPADHANAVNTVLADMGFSMELGFCRVIGKCIPEVIAQREDIAVKIAFEGEQLRIDAIDYADGFYGQPAFQVLEELSARLTPDKQVA